MKSSFATIPFDGMWLYSVAVSSELAATFADRQAAETLYGMLLPYRGQTVVAGEAAYAMLGMESLGHYWLAPLTAHLKR